MPDFETLDLEQFAGRDFGNALAHAGNASFDEVYDDLNRALTMREAWRADPHYMAKFEKFTKVLRLLKEGKIRSHQLQEVLTTSDFPILFGDVLDRRLLAQYQNANTSWQLYAQRGTVPDFRASRIIAIDGLQTPFNVAANKQPEQTEVQYDNNVAETGYTTFVEVYSKAYALSWRLFVNRALNFITRFPQLLANGARRTEEKFVTSLFVGSAGPNSTFFSNGNKNLINTTNGAASNNPALSIQGLRDAFNVMYRQVDSGGDPIAVDGVTLVVPPLLQLTAQEILQASLMEIVPPTSAIGTRYQTPNWASKIKLAVNWYLPIVDATANKHTTWYMFADPEVGRPAMEVTFLEGYENPSFWQKAPNTMRLGGAVDPMMGDFFDMSQHYKAMHILGGTLLDPKSAVVSNGSGS